MSIQSMSHTRTHLRQLPVSTPAALQLPAGVRDLSQEELRLIEGGLWKEVVKEWTTFMTCGFYDYNP